MQNIYIKDTAYVWFQVDFEYSYCGYKDVYFTGLETRLITIILVST